MSSTDNCAICHEPLLLQIEPDSDSDVDIDTDPASAVPDDLSPNLCGCHFHWECFLESDQYELTECPNCRKNIATDSNHLSSGTGPSHATAETESNPVVLCTIHNEGGIQLDFDILPIAIEECYLRTYPEKRIGRAYLEFCREGDVDAILCLIRDQRVQAVEGEEQTESLDVLRYTGKFAEVDGSGLHVAIRSGQEEVAWLLLGIGTNIEWEKFPKVVRTAFDAQGFGEADRTSGEDIRQLKDSMERLPESVAREVGAPWAKMLDAGFLTV